MKNRRDDYLKMAQSPLYVCIVVVLTHFVILAKGQTVTCQYNDSIIVNGTCFRYNSTPVTWAEGKAFCTSMNGALAKVETLAQIATALKNLSLYNDAWIGANDIDVEGTFIWDYDKSPVGDALKGLWGIGEPFSMLASFDCGEVYRASSISFKVYASDCTSKYGTLCMEMPLPTTNLTTTSTTSSSTMTPNTSTTTTTATNTTTTITTTTTTTIENTATITTITTTSTITTIPTLTRTATTTSTSEANAQ